ncbi:MAG TPA: hypothetical protein VF101_19165 [Gaiellaceae bacterium]
MSKDVIARLAAANPLPTGVLPRQPEPLVVPTRRIFLALALIVAVALPAVAFAGKLGDLLGLSNQGTPVATSSLDLSRDTGLDEAMRQLAFPSTMHLLGNENGVSFYAARRADGDYCFAIESAVAKGVGCDLDGTFPSPSRPVMVFPPLIQFAGFAADGATTVTGIDASGNAVVSAPVSGNLFASTTPGPFPSVVAIRALDAHGDVLATEHLPGR